MDNFQTEQNKKPTFKLELPKAAVFPTTSPRCYLAQSRHTWNLAAASQL